MRQTRKFRGSTVLRGILLATILAWIPMVANASLVFFADDFDVSGIGDGVRLIAFPGVAATPPAPDPVPIPYPVFSSASEDPATRKIKTTTVIAIRSEGIRRAAGDEPGVVNGEISTGNLGFLGNTVEFFWDNQVHPDETALLSIMLADPVTGQSLGPEYSVEVTDTQSGSVSFDLLRAPLPVFDIVLLAIQTSGETRPRSRLSVTDIAIDGVSVADQFSVALIPAPPAVLLFITGLLGLIYTKRSRPA